MEYRYYLFMDDYLARTNNKSPSEWYDKGKWVIDVEYSLALQDAMHDYGDYSVFDYKDLTEAEANRLITDKKIRPPYHGGDK